jgi:hypothetical protein
MGRNVGRPLQRCKTDAALPIVAIRRCISGKPSFLEGGTYL